MGRRARAAAVALAGVALAACASAPTDPHDPAVDRARDQAHPATRLAWLRDVDGAHPLQVAAERDVCVRPESTTVGLPSGQKLVCTITASDAVAVDLPAGAEAMHEALAARGCRPEGAEDLRAWAGAYAGRALPDLAYACPDGRLVFAGGPPVDLAPFPAEVGRNSEVVVREAPPAEAALRAAQASGDDLAVRVSAPAEYWRK